MKKLSASGESMAGWASAIIAQNYLSREDIIFRSWLCFTVLTVTNHGIDELFTIKKTAGLKRKTRRNQNIIIILPTTMCRRYLAVSPATIEALRSVADSGRSIEFHTTAHSSSLPSLYSIVRRLLNRPLFPEGGFLLTIFFYHCIK